MLIFVATMVATHQPISTTLQPTLADLLATLTSPLGNKVPFNLPIHPSKAFSRNRMQKAQIKPEVHPKAMAWKRPTVNRKGPLAFPCSSHSFALFHQEPNSFPHPKVIAHFLRPGSEGLLQDRGYVSLVLLHPLGDAFLVLHALPHPREGVCLVLHVRLVFSFFTPLIIIYFISCLAYVLQWLHFIIIWR